MTGLPPLLGDINNVSIIAGKDEDDVDEFEDTCHGLEEDDHEEERQDG
jgi:hypothetical protein